MHSDSSVGMLNFLFPNKMKRDYTASAYILEENRVLLIFHPKLKKWLPPGGHVESNETPHEAAHREALEETGLDIEWIDASPLQIDCWNAKTLPHPFLTLLEEIPQYRDIPAHQHVDFIFLARPKHSIQTHEEMQWFSLEQLKGMKADVEIFIETVQVIEYILTQKYV